MGVYEGDETIDIVSEVKDLEGNIHVFSEQILLKDDDPAPLEISVISDAWGSEASNLREGALAADTKSVRVSVPEGEAPAKDTTITLVAGGTACRQGDPNCTGDDYTLAQTVTLGAGERWVEATLGVIDDEAFEHPETLTLQATAGGYQPSPVVTVWIYDDNYSTLTVSADASTVSEPNGTVTVTMSVEEGKELTTEATVFLGPSGTATHKTDYRSEEEIYAAGQPALGQHGAEGD